MCALSPPAVSKKSCGMLALLGRFRPILGGECGVSDAIKGRGTQARYTKLALKSTALVDDVTPNIFTEGLAAHQNRGDRPQGPRDP